MGFDDTSTHQHNKVQRPLVFSTLTVMVLIQSDPETGDAVLQELNILLYEDALLRVHHTQ